MKVSFSEKSKEQYGKKKKSEKVLYLILGALVAEHAPTSAKYQITEYGLPTARDPSERAKFILKLHFINRTRFLIKKTQEHYASEKIDKNDLCLSLDALVGRAQPKY